MSSFQIDATDRKILSFLVQNARMPFLEIARECGVSGAAIHQRVKKLEAQGIITGSSLLVKPQTLGFNVCAFVCVSISNPDNYDATIKALKSIPEIVECHFVTGDNSLLLKLYCKDHNHLMNTILNDLQSVPGIDKTNTLLSLDQPIERQIQMDITENKSAKETEKEGKKKRGPKKKGDK